VTCVPEIKKLTFHKGEFLILACDGLWDVLSNEKAVEFVNSKIKDKNLHEIASELTDHALSLKSEDNVSVVIVALQ
jgi:serine/threonine protein phosphatase PrpC